MEKSPSKNQFCPVCNASIGFLSKKVECSNCKLLVCRDHSFLHENSNHFCDICEKSRIKSKHFSDLLYQIKSLQGDLQYLTKDKHKYRKEVLSKNDIITRLEKQSKANYFVYDEKLDTLEKKIAQEQEKALSEIRLIEHLQRSLNESQRSEKVMVEKLNNQMMELHQVKIEYEEMCENEKFLLKKIDKISVDMRGMTPVRKLSLLACKDCNKKIRTEYFEAYRTASIIEGRDSLISIISLSTQPVEPIPAPSSLCRACNII